MCLASDVIEQNASYITNMSTVIDNSKAWFSSLSAASLYKGLSSGKVLFQSNCNEIIGTVAVLSMRLQKPRGELCPLNLDRCGVWVSPRTEEVVAFSWLTSPKQLNFSWLARSLGFDSLVGVIHHRGGSKKLFDALDDPYTWFVVPIAVLGTDHPEEILERFAEVGELMNTELKNLLFK